MISVATVYLLKSQSVTNANFFAGAGQVYGQHIAVFPGDITTGNTARLKTEELASIRIPELLAATEYTHFVRRLFPAGIELVAGTGDNPAVFTFENIRSTVDLFRADNTGVRQETANGIKRARNVPWATALRHRCWQPS